MKQAHSSYWFVGQMSLLIGRSIDQNVNRKRICKFVASFGVSELAKHDRPWRRGILRHNQSSWCQGNKIPTPLVSQQCSDDRTWDLVATHSREPHCNGNHNQEIAKSWAKTLEQWPVYLVFTPPIQMFRNLLQYHHQQHQQQSTSHYYGLFCFPGYWSLHLFFGWPTFLLPFGMYSCNNIELHSRAHSEWMLRIFMSNLQ